MTAQLADAPFVRYRNTGLYAVPSIHYRQVFAQQVYQACWDKKFDVIAVELPSSYRQSGIVEAFLRMAPALGVILSSYGEPMNLPVPINNHPDCRKMESRSVSRALIHPMTPCDSIVMALRCRQLLSERWPGWEPEIALIDAEYQPRQREVKQFALRDDYEAIITGLPAFYARTEASWQSARLESVDSHREMTMAAHLRQFLNAGKEILFVCGAAHWKRIVEYLDQGVNKVPHQEKNAQTASPVLVAVEPVVGWLRGWLDDIPRVAWEFELACQKGAGNRFDKRLAVDQVVRESVAEAQQSGMPVSMRRLLAMERFQQSLLAGAGRWIPEVDAHLTHSAAVCVGDGFARLLKEVALRYPVPPPAGQPEVEFRLGADGNLFLIAGEQAFLVESAKGEFSTGSRAAIPMPARLSKEEMETVEKWPGVYRGIPEEQILHNRLIRRARQLAHRTTRETATYKFTGGLGQGLDSRRTIRSIATGERAIYVRFPRHRLRSGQDCDDRCPVVWIWDTDSTIVNTFDGFVPKEKHSNAMYCYSTFYWLRQQRNLPCNITENQIAYAVSLLRGMMSPYQRTLDDVRKLVESFPEKRLARVRPWADAELKHLQGYELAIGCAIKYADDHVVVVSLPSLRFSEALRTYAQAKGVRILRVSRDDFEREALERLSLDYNVPAPSQEELPHEIVYRFIKPVPL